VDNMNELNVNVLRCSKIASLDGKSQPSPYCVYKFFDFPDHDTEIIAASNFPEFNDHRSFAVHMDMDLDKYLKTFVLEVYVFDDNEAEDNGQYLGVAKIPLIELSHDRDIKGTFELKKVKFLLLDKCILIKNYIVLSIKVDFLLIF
jgi:protein fantom